IRIGFERPPCARGVMGLNIGRQFICAHNSYIKLYVGEFFDCAEVNLQRVAELLLHVELLARSTPRGVITGARREDRYRQQNVRGKNKSLPPQPPLALWNGKCLFHAAVSGG